MDATAILKEKYPFLKNIRIVESVYDYGDLKKRLGKEASKLFDILLSKYKNPRVGIGGGSTLYELVDCLEIKNRRIRIFPAILSAAWAIMRGSSTG